MRLGIVLRKWRMMNETNLKEASKAIGISLPTLSRIERGGPPDGKSLAKIIVWLLEEVSK